MSWWSKKSESPSVDDLLNMNDKEIRAAIDKGLVKQKNPKEVRKAAKQAKIAAEGEKGVKAIGAAMKGGGKRNYENIPLKDRVHPAEYKRILQREARKQGLL